MMYIKRELDVGTPKGLLLILILTNPQKVQDHCVFSEDDDLPWGSDLNHVNQVKWDGY